MVAKDVYSYYMHMVSKRYLLYMVIFIILCTVYPLVICYIAIENGHL